MPFKGYTEPKSFELWPEGNYQFRVMLCDGLEAQENGHDKLTLKLKLVDSTGEKTRDIYDFRYAGEDKNGEDFDMISPFCKALGETPTLQQASDPKYWKGLEGKVGVCHLIQIEAKFGSLAGQIVNQIKYYVYPDKSKGAAKLEKDVEKKRTATTRTKKSKPDNIPY